VSFVYFFKIYTDDTNGLTWQGFPLLVFGFSDAHRQFHPVLFMLASGKTSEDFAFGFQTIKGLFRFFNYVLFSELRIIVIYCTDARPQLRIVAGMSDAANAIFNGLETVYPDSVQLMCWMHVFIKNVLLVMCFCNYFHFFSPILIFIAHFAEN